MRQRGEKLEQSMVTQRPAEMAQSSLFVHYFKMLIFKGYYLILQLNIQILQ